MKEEIKEILDDLKKYVSEGGEHTLMEYEIKHIQCYITNLQEENERLNNIINRARRKLGEYKYYSTPTEEQTKENEDISEEVYQILHENLYKLKEDE